MSSTWRGARVVEWVCLENRSTRKGTGGSNPSLSAKQARERGACCSRERSKLACRSDREQQAQHAERVGCLKPPPSGKARLEQSFPLRQPAPR